MKCRPPTFRFSSIFTQLQKPTQSIPTRTLQTGPNPEPSIQPDSLGIQILVLENVSDQCRIFIRHSNPLRPNNVQNHLFLYLFRLRIVQRRPESTGSNGHYPDPERGEVTGKRKRHCGGSCFADVVTNHPRLGVERSDGCGEDNHATLIFFQGRTVFGHVRSDEAGDIELQFERKGQSTIVCMQH